MFAAVISCDGFVANISKKSALLESNRIYFAEVRKEIILLFCGGDKSTQTKDIKLAKQYWKELRGRK
jgi:putative addiction module killer protein